MNLALELLPTQVSYNLARKSNHLLKDSTTLSKSTGGEKTNNVHCTLLRSRFNNYQASLCTRFLVCYLASTTEFKVSDHNPRLPEDQAIGDSELQARDNINCLER
jgi:hypothetical protein